MKKITKDNLGCIIAVISAVLILILACVGILSLGPPNANKADRLLRSDVDLLKVVVQYLESTDGDVFIRKSVPYNISDDNANKAINQLFNRGYKSISKVGNTISFLRWTRWKDFGAGLAYTINGKDKPTLDYMVKLEPLSINRWYYYEES